MLLGVIDVTISCGTIISDIKTAVSLDKDASQGWITSRQIANIVIGANCGGILATGNVIAGVLGTSVVIVTEQDRRINAAIDFVTDIRSTNAAVVTNKSLRPITMITSR